MMTDERMSTCLFPALNSSNSPCDRWVVDEGNGRVALFSYATVSTLRFHSFCDSFSSWRVWSQRLHACVRRARR